MLSKLSERFRSFLASDNNSDLAKCSRKRSLEGSDDSRLPEKRLRQNTEGCNGQDFVGSFSRVSNWFARKTQQFQEKVKRSPGLLMKKISNLTAVEPPEDRRLDTRTYIQPGMRMEQNADMPFAADIMSGMPGMQVHSTPHPAKGYNFTDANFDLANPDMFSFVASPIDKFQAHSISGPPKYNNQLPHSGQLARPPIHSYTSHPSNVDKPTNGPPLPVFNKIIKGDGHQPRRRLHGHRMKNKMAAMECFRVEDHRRYRELLQTMTTVPLGQTSSGSSHGSSVRSRPPTFSVFKKDETILGMTVDTIGAGWPKKDSTLTSAVRAKNSLHSKPVTLSQDIPKAANYSTPRPANYSTTLSTHATLPSFRRRPSQNSEQVPVVIDLTECSDTSGHASNVSTRRTSRSESPVQVARVEKPKPQPKTPSAQALDKALSDCKYLQDEWLQGMKDKYSSESRQLERKASEEEIKIKCFKEKREDWEKDLERRIRQRLRLAEREIPPIEEDSEGDLNEFPELTEEQDDLVDMSLVGYPPGQKLVEAFRQELTRNDIQTLSGLNWLNDEVINFYMNLLMERGTQDGYPTVHAFNTFFYTKIIQSGQKSVRRWTKNVDIFAMDYVLVPVHLGMHWCLSVIDFRKKTIGYYDSMGGTNKQCLEALRKYLLDEHQDKKGQRYDMSDWKLLVVKSIPQQMNGSDCGMFSCKFAEYITRDASITFTQEHMPYFRRRMVYEIITKELM